MRRTLDICAGHPGEAPAVSSRFSTRCDRSRRRQPATAPRKLIHNQARYISAEVWFERSSRPTRYWPGEDRDIPITARSDIISQGGQTPATQVFEAHLLDENSDLVTTLPVSDVDGQSAISLVPKMGASAHAVRRGDRELAVLAFHFLRVGDQPHMHIVMPRPVA